MYSSPQGKSDLCVQRVDWTSDHPLVLSLSLSGGRSDWISLCCVVLRCGAAHALLHVLVKITIICRRALNS